MIDLIMEDRFEITGRGTIFTGSLSKNGLENTEGLIGEEFILEDVTYEITAVEQFRKMFGNPPLMGDNFSVMVKEKK